MAIKRVWNKNEGECGPVQGKGDSSS